MNRFGWIWLTVAAVAAVCSLIIGLTIGHKLARLWSA